MKWTVATFRKRLREFMLENPGITESEACSILGKRGSENRAKSSQVTNKKEVTEKIQNIIINNYFLEVPKDFTNNRRKSKSDVGTQLTLNFE